MINAYLDESGIHNGAEICVVAGYFGGPSQFKKLALAWRRVLAKHGVALNDFHTTDMAKTRRYQPMLLELTQTIGEYKISPISFGIVVADFNSYNERQRKFITGATLDEKTGKFLSTGCPNKPYFVPFQLCLKRVTAYAPIGGKANFFFGSDRPVAGYARSLFDQIKMQVRQGSWPGTTWKEKNRLGNSDFPLAKQTPELQAADLYCFLTYQHMLERHKAHDWDVRPSGLLANCLKNMRSAEDHAYQNKRCIDEMLEETRRISGFDWDAVSA
jgi:hypothetical protein